MPRRTSNIRLAAERLAEELDGVTLQQDPEENRIWHLLYGTVEYVGSVKRCLARLVEAAQFPEDDGGWGLSREEIADIVRLESVTDYGLPAHMFQTIREVTLPNVRPTHDNGGGP